MGRVRERVKGQKSRCCRAAGIPQPLSLAMQITFAQFMSTFSQEELKFILNYPQRNRFNTNVGDQLANDYIKR